MDIHPRYPSMYIHGNSSVEMHPRISLDIPPWISILGAVLFAELLSISGDPTRGIVVRYVFEAIVGIETYSMKY